MLNKAPVFLNCFGKGGSNIFLNLFLTHPNLCYPLTETVEIFAVRGNKDLRKTKWRKKTTIEGYLVALLSGQLRLFDIWNLDDRKPVSPLVQTIIDKTLHKWKLKVRQHEELKFKNENEIYTLDELKQARLVAKNNNGLVFLTDLLAQMYPDATFFALTRHPLPLYESYKRRNVPFEDFVDLYQKVTDKMLHDSIIRKNYHLVKFEDLLADPVTVMRRVHALAGVDSTQVKKIRFKAKSHRQEDGRYDASDYTRGQHYWFDFDHVDQILETNINAYQADRLEPWEKNALLEQFDQTLVRLGYA